MNTFLPTLGAGLALALSVLLIGAAALVVWIAYLWVCGAMDKASKGEQ